MTEKDVIRAALVRQRIEFEEERDGSFSIETSGEGFIVELHFTSDGLLSSIEVPF